MFFWYLSLILMSVSMVHTMRAAQMLVCEKKPRTDIPPTGADGRFRITVQTINKQYLPKHTYTVILESAREGSYFTEFLIMADGEYWEDKTNFRNHYTKEPGKLRPKIGREPKTQMHPACENSVQQANNSPKTRVEVEWQSPVAGQGCVTLHAMVAESQQVWYIDQGSLSTRICEDTRKIEDIEPLRNSNCNICEEAKYELTFEGQWSRNTHPENFPETSSIRFSDLVGASHADGYYLWDYDNKASSGLKLLAEAGNTTLLEQEIQKKFDSGVRTLIKAAGRGRPYMSEPTSAIFRVDKDHHLISTAASIVPSPDWFLGVSHFELCQEDNTWVPERELNLYLIDAGTDNGVSYESSNEETLPPQLITRIRERSDDGRSPFFNKNNLGTPRHFAKLKVQLIRVYKEACEETENKDTSNNEIPHGNTNEQDNEDQNTFTDTDTDAVTTSIDISVRCPMSAWHEWSECTPKCGSERNRYRERFHIVNGREYRYLKDNEDLPEPAPECNDVTMFETEKCESKKCIE